MRVAVAGASGFIGSALVPALESAGHSVVRIGRAHRTRPPDVVWDPWRDVLDRDALEGIDAAVNLTGEDIGQRWSADVKQRIIGSRVRSTALLARTLAALTRRPRVLVNMSGVGFYGDRRDEELDERSSSGEGFLAGLARAWEDATRPASEAGIRVVCARSGVVLHPSGSMLRRLIPIFQLGAGGTIGTGRQWLSWISRTDHVAAVLHLLGAESLGGAVNVTAPQPVTNAEFTKTFARVLHRPALAVVPEFVVKLVFGEMGEETVLAGQRALPRRLLESGFAFGYPALERALRHELAAR